VNSRRLEWAEHVSRMGRTRKGYRILVGKPLPATHLEASKSITFKSIILYPSTVRRSIPDKVKVMVSQYTP